MAAADPPLFRALQIQVHGGEGISQDQVLAQLWAGIRTLRFADGPDEVHIAQIGKTELKRAPGVRARREKMDAAEARLFEQQGLRKHRD